jgi:hypothetical protein
VWPDPLGQDRKFRPAGKAARGHCVGIALAVILICRTTMDAKVFAEWG